MNFILLKIQYNRFKTNFKIIERKYWLFLQDAERLTKTKTVESDVNHPSKCLPTSVQSNVPAVYCPGSADTSLHLTQESPRDTDTQHSSTTMVTEEVIYERQKH
jgi:hypothetical protein